MKHFKKLLLILIFVLLIFWGCEGDEATGPDNVEMTIENYYPLAIDNSWSYIDTTTGFTWNPRITGSQEYEGTILYKIIDPVPSEYMSGAWDNTDERFVGYKDNEVLSLFSIGEDTMVCVMYDTIGTVLLKEPLEVGTEWITMIWPWHFCNWEPMQMYTFYIEKTDMHVEVPAGSFSNCIKVDILEDNAFTGGYFIFAPGVGLIKYKWPDWEEDHFYELQFYKI